MHLFSRAGKNDMDLKDLLNHGWIALIGLIGLVYKKNENELDRQRDKIAKIFDKLETHAQRSEDRHHELIRMIHEGLAHKVDK